MALSNVILNNLAGLQNSNFEVCDVKVFKDHETWVIKRKPHAKPICNNCDLPYEFKPHSVSTIELIDQPAGRFKRIWRIERAKLSCPCRSKADKSIFSSSSPGGSGPLSLFVARILMLPKFWVV